MGTNRTGSLQCLPQETPSVRRYLMTNERRGFSEGFFCIEVGPRAIFFAYFVFETPRTSDETSQISLPPREASSVASTLAIDPGGKERFMSGETRSVIKFPTSG